MSPIVIIEWIDSGVARSNGWESEDEIVGAIGPAQMRARTVGFLIHDVAGDDIVIVAQSEDVGNGGFLNAQAIYRPNIICMTWLEGGLVLP